MKKLSSTIIALVALEHIWFLVLEMFLWEHDIGLQTFGNTAESARATATLAANQGLYNGFVAVGLFFGLLHKDKSTGFTLQWFFLACIIVAGVYGAVTVKMPILYIQAMPAAVGLVLLLLFAGRGAVKT